MTGDGSIVELTLRIEASPEIVWRYWTDPDRLCEWWGTAARLDPTPAGVCIVEIDGGIGVMRGEFVDVVPHERLVFTFGWDPTPGAPDVAPGSTLVEVTLQPDGDATILTLRHTGLPPGALDQHAGGWRHFLTRIPSAEEPA